MMQPPSTESSRQVLDEMARALSPLLYKSVTPIAALDESRSYQWGTGTLFRVADEFFLVTACHVFDTAEKHGFSTSMCFFDLGEDGEGMVALRPVPLAGMVHRVKDPPDVAVVELEPWVVAQVTARQFLRLSEVALRPSEDGCFWVFGFPAEMTEQVPDYTSLRYREFFFRVPLHNGEPAIENFHREHHFLLDAAHDDLRLNDGTPARMPSKLEGISGCSIWQTSWPKGEAGDDFNPRIVGVETSYYRRPPVIKATHWGAVASVLYQARPDLRGAIEMNFGSA